MVDPYDDFQEDTLIQKKALILSIVKKLCTKRNLPLPHVNFEYCADEHENQLAHYHPGENIICFSKRQLIIQSIIDKKKLV